MEMLGRSLDQAVSAFIEDVHARGLDKKILLVITGDFGRTPKVNGKGGRDHWARLGTLAFSGGALNLGQVIGQSARGADVPATDPINAANLMATVFHTLFDVGKLRLDPAIPADLSRVIQAHEPIHCSKSNFAEWVTIGGEVTVPRSLTVAQIPDGDLRCFRDRSLIRRQSRLRAHG